jgi:hypothetical protein
MSFCVGDTGHVSTYQLQGLRARARESNRVGSHRVGEGLQTYNHTIENEFS